MSIRPNWKFLCNLTAIEFLEAASALEGLGFGQVHNMPVKVFVKRKPEEIHEALSRNQDLCSAEVYALRYARFPSRYIGLSLRGRLVAKKLVSEKQMM